MAALLIKASSIFMSLIVLLSNAFPALFGGKIFVDPNGDAVTIVENVDIGDENIVISDYEAFKALGDVGVSYDEKFFETNNLAVFSVEYDERYTFYLTSICIDGKNMEARFYIDPPKGVITMNYMPTHKTVFIETTKDVTMLRSVKADSVNFFKPM
ncbi:MAG: hypothetical protein IJ395_03620 [Clostridia bacterium]|nr:hypothetical protein [Clostridia bacterium]